MEQAKFFGEVAIERGHATREQVLDALKEQYRLRCVEKRHLFLGEVMVHLGTLRIEQLDELVRECGGYHETPLEQRQKVFFGDVAVQLGFVTPAQLFRALQQQRDEDSCGRRHRLVGEVLLDMGALGSEGLSRVIATMVELGYSDYRTGMTPPMGEPMRGFVAAGTPEMRRTG